MDEWMDGSVVVVQRGVSVSVAARRTPVPTISTFGTLDLAEPVSAISPSPYSQHSLTKSKDSHPQNVTQTRQVR